MVSTYLHELKTLGTQDQSLQQLNMRELTPTPNPYDFHKRHMSLSTKSQSQIPNRLGNNKSALSNNITPFNRQKLLKNKSSNEKVYQTISLARKIDHGHKRDNSFRKRYEFTNMVNGKSDLTLNT